jgi:penicillin-binding protein-related factor A (putative recombinase)
MAATPEAKVKTAVRAVLSGYKIYGYWPVPGGYGKATLDFLGCVNGWYFAIETKAPGQKPTPRQLQTIDEMTAAGAVVFVIDGQQTQLDQLRKFLDYVTVINPMQMKEGESQ